MPSQLSVQSKVAGGFISAKQLTVTSVCAGKVGASSSPTVIICSSVTLKLQPSVYVQVLVIISGQVAPLLISAPVTFPVPSQSSAQFNVIIAGTEPTQTVTSAGALSIVGA